MSITDFWKDKRIRIIFISCFFWGLLAHGMALFYKVSYHDDIAWPTEFWDAETFGLGRWGLALLGNFVQLFFGSSHYSTPAFHGLVTIICIAIILCLLVLKLRIESPLILVALSGAMVGFPAITCAFGFIYVAPYYYFGAMLGVLGAYIYYTYKDIRSFLVCSLLMAFSTGVYQSNIAINLIVLLLFMMDLIFESDLNWKDYVILAIQNALICFAFMGEYFALNKLFLAVRHVELSGYKGISSFGMTSVMDYPIRVFEAYKRFLKPADYIGTQGVSANMFPGGLKYYHLIMIVITIVLLCAFIRSFTGTIKKIQMCLMIAVAPLFAYFIYVMVGEPEVHGLMTYGEVFLFFIPVYLIERGIGSKAVIKYAGKLGLAIMLIMGLLFARFANVCYLKAQIMQAEAISYYTSLISTIQSAKGYTNDTPILYIGENNKHDEAVLGDQRFEPIWLPPYNGDSIINDYNWKETMKMWCGFSPVYATVEEKEKIDTDVINKMPTYPDHGSVKLINGVVVVKFSD